MGDRRINATTSWQSIVLMAMGGEMQQVDDEMNDDSADDSDDDR